MYEEVKDWKLLNWAKQIVDIVMDGVSDNVQYLLDHMVSEGDRLYRLQVKLNEQTAPMDNANPDNIKALKLLAEDLIFNERKRIEAIARILKSAG
jgi:hypothetical protein